MWKFHDLMKKKTSVTTVERSVGCGQSGAEQPRFTFTGKPGIHVHLEDPGNPLECFWFLHSRNSQRYKSIYTKMLGETAVI
jgi:hypothetical protein